MSTGTRRHLKTTILLLAFKLTHENDIVNRIYIPGSTHGIGDGNLYKYFVRGQRPQLTHLASQTKSAALLASYL